MTDDKLRCFIEGMKLDRALDIIASDIGYLHRQFDPETGKFRPGIFDTTPDKVGAKIEKLKRTNLCLPPEDYRRLNEGLERLQELVERPTPQFFTQTLEIKRIFLGDLAFRLFAIED